MPKQSFAARARAAKQSSDAPADAPVGATVPVLTTATETPATGATPDATTTEPTTPDNAAPAPAPATESTTEAKPSLRQAAHAEHNDHGHRTDIPGYIMRARTSGDAVAIRTHLHAPQSIAQLSAGRFGSLLNLVNAYGHLPFTARALQQKHLAIFLSSGIAQHIPGTGITVPDPKHPGRTMLTDDKAGNVVRFILSDATLYHFGRPVGDNVKPHNG